MNAPRIHTLPAGSMAQAPVSTSMSTFDLFDYVRGTTNVDVAAQMAQSIAWRLDVMIQGAARQLFKTVREHQYASGVDGLSELTMALQEQAFAEQAFAETGSSTDGPVTIIKELMLWREAAHNLAHELTSFTVDFAGQPKHYEVPDLDGVFFQEVNLKVKPQTKRRMTMSIDRRAKAYDLTPEEKQAQLAKRILREEGKLKDVGTTLQEQAGAVYEMFRQACAATLDADVGQCFHTMATSSQRVLIESAMLAADRAEDYATSSSSLSDAEFDDVCMTVLCVNKELKAVLTSPRFRNAAQQEAAAAVNVG